LLRGYGPGRLGEGLASAQGALVADRDHSALRSGVAELKGWRGPYWHYHGDRDPVLAPIRWHPEFEAVVADIERDVARQRAGQ
jgi:hypothetical protein